MLYDEEKDYVMRMIREVSRVLFSIIFGKQYTQVETEIENKYQTAGTPQNALRDLVDRGEINRAENMLLEDIDRCEAFEFFSGCKVEVDNTIVFPGNLDEAFNMLGDFERKYDCFINLRQSIGITAPDGNMESILFGKKGYYNQLIIS